MATLCLVRIDSRMIHGQVMTMWSKTNGINHILAIDDATANDPFMRDIYTMAVPHTLKVMIVTVADAAKMWQDGTLPDDRYLVLFKDVHTALNAWKAGFRYDSLQVGNLTPEKKTKILHPHSRLSVEHVPELQELQAGGVEVYAQSVPTEKKSPLGELVKKM